MSVDLETMVRDYLLELGFLPPKSGYFLLKKLIISAMEGEEILPLRDTAYQKLSVWSGKSVATVEKNIQNSISDAWLRGDIRALYRNFGETVDADRGKPSNKQFIMTALEALQLKARRVRE